ncbi:MAG: hypothetical protein II704_08720 [Erysipelotrichaceae bacterium]|nr:hypothetical protein [Erysipelotrichaceae bacterium]
MKNKLYVLLEAILLGTIMYAMKFTDGRQTYLLMYSCIVINTLMIVMAENNLVKLGLVITLIADTFLVLLNDYWLWGVGCFCLVQTCYALHIGLDRKQLIIRAAVLVIAEALLGPVSGWDLLAVLSIYSFTQLFFNSVYAFVRKVNTRFSWGLLLFLLCDLNVGLMNIGSYVSAFPAAVGNLAAYLSWLFYVPSQVLIVLSLI